MAAQLELVQAFKPQLPYYLGPIENGVLPYLDQICAKAADEGVTPNQSVCLDAYYAHLDEMESA
jgi:hypothetical protein